MRLMHVSVCLVVVALTGCAHRQALSGPSGAHELKFGEVLITGDLELAKLNDEELFAAGTSLYASEDYAQAARYFGRICDFHPSSKHYRLALFNAGLALEKLKEWEEAWVRFSVLADASKGTGDALDAAFRLAECDYQLERYADATLLLRTIADRTDVSVDQRLKARVQQGVCEVFLNRNDTAENTLRSALAYWNSLTDKDLVDDYFPGQAQFFLGEIFRIHYESVQLDADKTTEKLAEDLEYKSELLLSSQGHYLRAIRVGNGYWATAAGNRIGGLYENMYDHMLHAPAPRELLANEQEVYRTELRRKIRVLIGKAITVYERTLEAAERIGASSPFVQQTRESLQRMKDLLLVEAKAEEGEKTMPLQPGS